MKILLLSPIPRIDPACGDVVYTEMLLAHPPDGVQYETYADALKRGALIEHGRRDRFAAEPVLTAVSKIINIARKRRWLFWEPFRIFSVRPGEYDLVHVHVFNCGFRQIDCPLVFSNACPIRFLYTEARGYSKFRVRIVEAVELLSARLLGVNLTSYWLPQATRLIVFTEFLRRWYVEREIFPADRIDVVPIYLPPAPAVSKPNGRPSRVGFIAKDFAAKGGETLLAAFEIVRQSRPEAELVIVGCPPRIGDGELKRRRIKWIPYVAREKLLREIIPGFDVFAYPTRFDGMPLVLLEAMAAGVPMATSDLQAMPEIVGEGVAGLSSPVGEARLLAQNILRLLEPEPNVRFRAGAMARFRGVFSASAATARLRAAYLEAGKLHRARNAGTW